MIIVTGGAGFIGSNLVRALNRRGREDVLVVDNLKRGEKFTNLVGCSLLDYQDKEDFLRLVRTGQSLPGPVEAVFHQGACSDTTEEDGAFMMRNNYDYSKALLHYCQDRQVPFLYASSAAVYGTGPRFEEDPEHERPLNVYGYSKYQFDQYVRRRLPRLKSQVVGLRYFNVYGPGEAHKGRMASVIFHFDEQLRASGRVRLFGRYGNYEAGEQRRDFIYVDDAVEVCLWLADHPECSGIFNIGTGRSRTFNEVAQTLIRWHGFGTIEYLPFPDHLRGRYQSFTEADLRALRRAGYPGGFKGLEEGVRCYLEWLSL